MPAKISKPDGRPLSARSSSNSLRKQRKENHDDKSSREDIAPNQTVHQRPAISRLRRVDESGAIKRMVGTRERSYPQLRRRRAGWRKISLGPHNAGRRGNERVWRIPGAGSGKENCLHVEVG